MLYRGYRCARREAREEDLSIAQNFPNAKAKKVSNKPPVECPPCTLTFPSLQLAQVYLGQASGR